MYAMQSLGGYVGKWEDSSQQKWRVQAFYDGFPFIF